LFAVKTEEFLGVGNKKTVAEHDFRRIVKFLMVQAVDAAEIRDSALGRNARPAKKHDVAALLDQPFQLRYHGAVPFLFAENTFIIQSSGRRRIGLPGPPITTIIQIAAKCKGPRRNRRRPKDIFQEDEPPCRTSPESMCFPGCPAGQRTPTKA